MFVCWKKFFSSLNLIRTINVALLHNGCDTELIELLSHWNADEVYRSFIEKFLMLQYGKYDKFLFTNVTNFKIKRIIVNCCEREWGCAKVSIDVINEYLENN